MTGMFLRPLQYRVHYQMSQTTMNVLENRMECRSRVSENCSDILLTAHSAHVCNWTALQQFTGVFNQPLPTLRYVCRIFRLAFVDWSAAHLQAVAYVTLLYLSASCLWRTAVLVLQQFAAVQLYFNNIDRIWHTMCK
jgi:hypothetical protein